MIPRSRFRKARLAEGERVVEVTGEMKADKERNVRFILAYLSSMKVVKATHVVKGEY